MSREIPHVSDYHPAQMATDAENDEFIAECHDMTMNDFKRYKKWCEADQKENFEHIATDGRKIIYGKNQ
tara:strand:+ start:1039 stop:1245 length:207 start_codon:yes stop_codon:yes gene_type:complete